MCIQGCRGMNFHRKIEKDIFRAGICAGIEALQKHLGLERSLAILDDEQTEKIARGVLADHLCSCGYCLPSKSAMKASQHTARCRFFQVVNDSTNSKEG